MSRESAQARALLWWRQADADLRACKVLATACEWSHSCFQAQQPAGALLDWAASELRLNP